VKQLAAIFLGAAFFLCACGGDGGVSTEASGEEGEVEETIKLWLTEGGCERMTDEFLESQTFNDDPEEACDTFEANFSAPSYGPDDIVVSDIQIDGDEATATVGDEISDIESAYTLTNESGAWQIVSAEL
jgi:hypothetical protein